MTHKEQLTYKNNLLSVISLSRQHKEFLTSTEIMMVHQHLNLKKPLTTKVKNKINKALELIERLDWQRPITRYNSEYQIEKLNQKTGLWQIVK